MSEEDIMFRRFQILKFSKKRMVPTVTMTIDIDVTKMIELRKASNIINHITILHIVMKAVADTLEKFPILYSYFNGTKIINNSEIILNIPVNVENHVEYIVIRAANTKSLTEISKECINELEKIHNKEGEFIKYIKRLNAIPSFIQKLYTIIPGIDIHFMRNHYGNFAISNFGSFNINNGSLALSQPMVASLCIGVVSPSLSTVGKQYRTTMNLPITISFDHRAIDGAYAGYFLNKVKNLLENPDCLFNFNK